MSRGHIRLYFALNVAVDGEAAPDRGGEGDRDGGRPEGHAPGRAPRAGAPGGAELRRAGPDCAAGGSAVERLAWECGGRSGTQDDAERWERSAEQLSQGLSELGARLALCAAGPTTAYFCANVPAGLLSEAVRLSMSWVGRSPKRWADLTGPRGGVLRLTAEPGGEERDTLLAWLTTNMHPRHGSGG